MSWLNRMYAGSRSVPGSDKNPNRVTGGMRAQGVDRVSFLGEDGQEHQVPSLQYVAAQDEKIRKQQAAINVLERKLARTEKEIETVKAMIPRNPQ